MSGFKWTENRTNAAVALASGKSRRSVAKEQDISERTISRWMQDPEFKSEVDRLTLSMGIAARAERLRIVQRIVNQMVTDDQHIMTEKDLLDWLKYAQSETDGSKHDITSGGQPVQIHTIVVEKPGDA